MSNWTLNSVDFDTYGLIPGHASDSNIALSGCFDLPARIGNTHHNWADEDGVEPFVTAGEIMFGGRELTIKCSILAERANIDTYLASLYSDIAAFTDLVALSTPYGSFQVYIRQITPEYLQSAANVTIVLREPVVTLTGGALPATGANNHQFDGIPFVSFGLYLSASKDFRQLAEMKDQNFTKYGSEGWHIVKRKEKTLLIEGFIVASSLADFQAKIKALYLLFKSSGLRTIVLRSATVTCFATQGFKVDNIYLFTNGMVANFSISLICVTIT